MPRHDNYIFEHNTNLLYNCLTMIGYMKRKREIRILLANYSLIFYVLQRMVLALINQMVYNRCVMMEVSYDSIRHGKRTMQETKY